LRAPPPGKWFGGGNDWVRAKAGATHSFNRDWPRQIKTKQHH
jgi:hypothetical protein